MAVTLVKAAASPSSSPGNVMTVGIYKPFDFNGVDLSASLPTQVVCIPTAGSQWTAGLSPVPAPGQLTAAGVAAMGTAVAAYLAGLSAANKTLLANCGLGNGLIVTNQYVSCLAAPNDSGTLATAIAGVLATGSNVAPLGSLG
jgi:hypothetical protein